MSKMTACRRVIVGVYVAFAIYLVDSVLGEDQLSSSRPLGDNPSVLLLKEFEAEFKNKSRDISESNRKKRYESANALLRSMIAEEVYENGRRRVIEALMADRERPT